MLTKMKIFIKSLTKIEIFINFQQNRDFSTILTKFDILEQFDKNQSLFANFD